MKDITINVDFKKSPFNSKPNNSLKDYAEQIKKENNKLEYLENQETEKVMHQVVGYERYQFKNSPQCETSLR
jgi:hypothetical protein